LCASTRAAVVESTRFDAERRRSVELCPALAAANRFFWGRANTSAKL